MIIYGGGRIKKNICDFVFMFCFVYIILSLVIYNGFYLDFFKQKKVYKFSELDIINDSVNVDYSDGLYFAKTSDPNIYLPAIKDYDYLVIEISDLEVEGENVGYIPAQIFYIDNGYYSEGTSRRFEIKEGINCYKLITYREYQEIRIDIGEQEKTSCELTLYYCNKFCKYGELLKYTILISFICFVIYLWMKVDEAGGSILKRDNGIVEILNDFWLFCSRNMCLGLYLFTLGIIINGIRLSEFTISIDEENHLTHCVNSTIYLELGRYTQWILSKIFEFSELYVPYITLFMGVLFFTCSSLILLYILGKWSGKVKCGLPEVIFGTLYLSMPCVIGEVINFGHVAVYQAIGMCFCAISVVCISYVIEGQFDILQFVIGSILLFFALGIYQSLITVYCILFLFRFLILMLKNDCRCSSLKRSIILIGIPPILTLSMYFVSTTLIKSILIGKKSYISGYLTDSFIGWNKWMENDWVLDNVWNNFQNVVTGKYYSSLGGTGFFITFFALFIWCMVKLFGKPLRYKILFLVCSFMIVVLPFSIMILFGSFNITGRTLLALPLSIGFIWYVILNDLEQKKHLKVLVGFIAVIVSIKQVEAYALMGYSDYVRYELDRDMITLLMHDICSSADVNDKPIVFLGKKSYSTEFYLGNNISGMESYMDIGDNNRLIAFINAMGYTLLTPDDNQVKEAQKYIETLSVWPKDNSFIEMEDYIIVRVGE